MDKQTNNLTPAQTAARRENSRQSTGPRTCRGKRRSSRNALKHGIYSDVHYFYWEAARDLGEDPNDFTQLFQGLLEARRPADVLEHVLVEDIAVLIWKKARLERAESAVQVCNVRRHDLERYRQCIQVGRDVTSVSQSEVFEKGLRVGLDAPGKYESVLQMLGMLEEMTERNEFNPTMHRLLRAMYGDKPTMRGAGLLNRFLKLRQMREKGQNVGEAKQVFEFMLSDEHRDVLEEYELFLREHVENTRSARIAAMAPSHAQWAAIIRQQNALHRQLERKIRLLDEIQERRRRNRGSAEELLSKLMPPGFRSGGEPAPTTPEAPVGASRGAHLSESASDETVGVAPASQKSEMGCVRGSGQCEEEGVADMPQCGTPAPPDETAQERGADMPNNGTPAPPCGFLISSPCRADL